MCLTFKYRQRREFSRLASVLSIAIADTSARSLPPTPLFLPFTYPSTRSFRPRFQRYLGLVVVADSSRPRDFKRTPLYAGILARKASSDRITLWLSNLINRSTLLHGVCIYKVLEQVHTDQPVSPAERQASWTVLSVVSPPCFRGQNYFSVVSRVKITVW